MLGTDKHIKSRVWRWFIELPLEKRATVLSIEDKHCVQLIQCMYQRKVAHGEGLFYDGGLVSNSATHSVADEFCFIKLSTLARHHNCNYPECLLTRDIALEEWYASLSLSSSHRVYHRSRTKQRETNRDLGNAYTYVLVGGEQHPLV